MSGAVWRLLRDGAGSAAWNMSVDEALLLEARTDSPVLRLYGWERPSLSLGYRQDPEPWLERARALGIDVVRRASGGGAVLHGGDLTYAIVAPRGVAGVPADARGSGAWIRDWLLEALRRAGLAAVASSGVERAAHAEVCFSASTGTEIDLEGLKLVGSAQRRTRFGFLQHGSIRLHDDAGLVRALFGEASGYATRAFSTSAEPLRCALVASFGDAVGGRVAEASLREREAELAYARASERACDPLALPPLSLRTAPISADSFS